MYDKIVNIQRTKLFYLETGLFLVALLLINVIFFPQLPAFKNISPNPLWLVVLLIPARYGRIGALFSGAMTAAVFIGSYWFFYGIDIFFDDPWLLRFPFLFILVGFLLGELKTFFIQREDYLTKRLNEVQNLNEKMMREYDIIKDAHSSLSKDIATTQNSITVFHNVMERLKSFNREDIYNGLVDSFVDYLEVEECSLYELEGNLLKLKINRGWKDYHKRPEVIKNGEGLVGIASQKMKAISIKDFLTGSRDASKVGTLGDGLAAIPVVDSKGKLYAIVSIEKMPFIKMKDATIQTAGVICDIAASSLLNADRFNKVSGKQIENEKYGIYTYDYFLKRLNEEFLRSLNYMMPLSTIVFKLQGMHIKSEESKDALFSTLTSLVKNQLRSFDVTAAGPNEEVPLVILLAMTAGEKAEQIKQNMIEKLKEYAIDDLISAQNLHSSIIVQDYDPHTMSSSKDMLKSAGL